MDTRGALYQGQPDAFDLGTRFYWTEKGMEIGYHGGYVSYEAYKKMKEIAYGRR